jgi:putative spermidine/putrescine transport system permease protein
LPLLLFLLIFYVGPVLSMLSRGLEGSEGLSLDAYVDVLTDASFISVMRITLTIAVLTTVLCVLIGYPVAYAIARTRQSTANLLMLLVLMPFWTSILVRTYAWMVLLGRRGVINDALIGIGLIERPLSLLNTRVAVYIAMVHVLLPFVILPLYAALRAFDWRLVNAARGLQVTLPMSIPAVAAGTVLVFTLSVGFYITPALVGGPSDLMVAQLIDMQVRNFNWNTAAAMATVLLVTVLAVCAAFARFVPLNSVMRR